MKQLLTSVVREIRTLRSVGTGERATAPGHLVAISDGRPYRDNYAVVGENRLHANNPSLESMNAERPTQRE